MHKILTKLSQISRIFSLNSHKIIHNSQKNVQQNLMKFFHNSHKIFSKFSSKFSQNSYKVLTKVSKNSQKILSKFSKVFSKFSKNFVNFNQILKHFQQILTKLYWIFTKFPTKSHKFWKKKCRKNQQILINSSQNCYKIVYKLSEKSLKICKI